ncbi:siderophore-interacting protein [Tsukamurella tyrosinosolvens]|uniref:siderophore-interacting protein n=1 Tax=Tsukamurella tyrosinosolvens TaxID=57704 RepID=UPI0036A57284
MAWTRFAGTLIDRYDVTASIFRADFEISTDANGHEYAALPVGDESVGLYFARGGALLDTQASTASSAHGGWETVEDERSTGRRNLTVRAFDPSTAVMSIDVAHHASGVAMDWFESAHSGWQVLMAGARSWYRPPRDNSAAAPERQFLIADLAGLPALARILENTAPNIDVTAVIEVPTPGDVRYLPEHPRLELLELIGSGNGIAESLLSETVSLNLGTNNIDAYYWVAAETTQTRMIRKYLKQIGVANNQYAAVGYWTDTTNWGRSLPI